MFVAAASPQKVGAYRICHILGIADAAKKHICHLLAAESHGASGVTLVKPFCKPSEFLFEMDEKYRCAPMYPKS